MKLIFSQAITLTSAQPLKVTLGEDTQVLDEVVVTALGIKRATKALSYNVQEVKGDELTTVKSANFMNSLAGKVAGVNINASSSGVGGATRVIMRGTKSISSDNNALYVIDGVPIFNTNKGDTNGQYSAQPRGEGISDINPEDIESMEVLKDAGATAIYGARANDGVVLVTTKRGKSGRAEVNLKAKFGLNYFKDSYNFMNAGDYLYWMRTGYMNAYVGDMKHPDGAGIKGWSSLSGLTTATPYGTGNLYFDKDGVTPLDGNKTSSAIWSPMLYSDNLSFLLDQGWQTMIDPIYGDKIIYKNNQYCRLQYQYPIILSRL